MRLAGAPLSTYPDSVATCLLVPEAAGLEGRTNPYRNWRRPHGSLGGKTPVDRVAEVGETTPLAEQVESVYDGLKARIRHREWRVGVGPE